ncbi:cell wall hydrolase [Calderihabitans maritimus]|uniref:Cell wall hydrolase SleB n=1 Tax=Calderihabitans maritimus TaxID=1246530 RepID=A0A1Z5HQB3_9FIRM|nr:cell wall hydrolase [Calderihabitans maritimus]GAW91628.1 cell wall hydrolase SleB [Calderihabitans maritimus]
MQTLRSISILILVLFFTTVVFSLPSEAAIYTVQRGDSLYIIGNLFSVPVSQIQKDNRLNSTTIYPGQRLWLPDDRVIYYTVKAGDSLYLIGKKYNVSPYKIRKANGLSGTTIFPGQQLMIPTKTREYASAPSRSWPYRNISRKDLDLLAQLVYGEARGEPYKGQVAVAAVVLNRVKHPEFPNTIAGVIYQPDAFTAVKDGQFYLTPNETAKKAAQDALKGWDPSGGALYYWNPATATSRWIWTRTIITRIGQHVFGI